MLTKLMGWAIDWCVGVSLPRCWPLRFEHSHCLFMQVDADDANVPSLLSIPLLGYRYDTEIYRTTRARILSNKNPMASRRL